MPKPRKDQINVSITRYYCITMRCVRSGWLCGEENGKNYEHRRAWILAWLGMLENIFAIKIGPYAIMSNHYHVVLRIDPDEAADWSDWEVVNRWLQLYKGNPLAKRFLGGSKLSESEEMELSKLVEQWRERLQSISQFMAKLNETIARMANKEDKCTGRFWEGRFKSQALMEQDGRACMMAYVDLNPVRAGAAKDIASSNYTSGQQRLRELMGETVSVMMHDKEYPAPRLLKICDTDPESPLTMTTEQYLELLDDTGRSQRHDKKGYIQFHHPKLLDMLNFTRDKWQELTESVEGLFSHFVGSEESLRSACSQIGQKKLHGVSMGRKYFSQS